MRAHVRLQVVGARKSLFALGARVPLFRHWLVDRLVLFHRCLCRETFAAERAEEGPRPVRVLPLFVSSKSAAGVESLTTVVTFVRSQAGVDPHVSAQCDLLVEGFATGMTHKGTVASVNPGFEELERIRRIARCTSGGWSTGTAS